MGWMDGGKDLLLSTTKGTNGYEKNGRRHGNEIATEFDSWHACKAYGVHSSICGVQCCAYYSGSDR